MKFSDLSADDQQIISKTSKLRKLGASENLILFLLQEYQKVEDDEAGESAFVANSDEDDEKEKLSRSSSSMSYRITLPTS